ncbi:MAG: DUF5060 domain-containing protein [bacterium]
MKKLFTLLGAVVIFLSAFYLSADASRWSQNKQLKINSINENSNEVGQFELFEVTLDISATFDNPFDPEEIDVTGHFTSPSGKEIDMPGFFFQNYIYSPRAGEKLLDSLGKPVWKVRFAPRELGKYKYFVSVRDKKKEANTKTSTFTSVASDNPGFLRPSKTAPHYFEFESGKSFFGVGQSVAWVETKYKDHKYYFSKMRESGCNISRIWTVPWHIALEWTNKGNKKGDFDGIGLYNMSHAWKLDEIISVAKDSGIYFMLTMANYGDLMVEKGPWNEEMWKYNPYNIENGGFCKTPEEFFTNAKARKQYKKRMRYVVARWGYTPNIFAFEFFNEYKIPVHWAKEMSGYIKEIDPASHMVSASLWYPPSIKYDENALWSLDEIDFSQIHLYGYKGVPADLSGKLITDIHEKITKYDKPCLVAEFGIDSAKDNRFYDKKGTGVNLHNGLWAATLAGSSAGVLNWWWNSYVDPKNLYSHFAALANFVSRVEWNKGKWEIMGTSYPEKAVKKGSKKYEDMVIQCISGWGDLNSDKLTILNTGEIQGGIISNYLHSPEKDDIRTTPEFTVNYPSNGKFILHVDSVSTQGHLLIYLDGKEVLSKKLPTGPKGEGQWKDSTWLEEWNVWQSKYDKDFEIDVPKGNHTIRLENTGKDWIRISLITLTGYKIPNVANVRAIGLKRGDEGLLWLQNIDSNWYTDNNNEEPKPEENVHVTLYGFSDGQYSVQWWDTWKGEVIETSVVTASEGELTLGRDVIETDIAAIIRKK